MNISRNNRSVIHLGDETPKPVEVAVRKPNIDDSHDEKEVDSTPRPLSVTPEAIKPPDKLAKVRTWVATAAMAALTAAGFNHIYSAQKEQERDVTVEPGSYVTVNKVSPLINNETADKRVEQMRTKRLTLSLSTDNRACTVSGIYPEKLQVQLTAIDDGKTFVEFEVGPGNFSKNSTFPMAVKGFRVRMFDASGKELKISKGDGDIFGSSSLDSIEAAKKHATEEVSQDKERPTWTL